MTDTTTTPPVARHSVGDVDEFCTPRLDGVDLVMTFEGGRTVHHDITDFTVKASIGAYKFESADTSFTLTFVDKSTGAAMSAVAAAGAVAVLGSAAAGVSVGNSAVRHIHAMDALVASGYNDFYEPLKAVAGKFKESWRVRPAMLIRYAMSWITLPLLVGGSVLLLFGGPMLGMLAPGLIVSSVLTDQTIPKTLLAYGMTFAFVSASVIWVPIARIGLVAMLGMLAQNYWATPPQQCEHLNATTGRSSDDPDRLRNLLFYNKPRWISVVMPYAALTFGFFMLLKQYNNPEIDVSNDGSSVATAIMVAFVAVQFVFAIKMLIESKTMQCDETAWMDANITAENSLMNRANLVPLLRHGAFAGLLLVGAAALFSLA